ncbi:ubiquinol-cytochrome c reductase iron-sulfur subunit [Chloroflexota bacterium]
MSENITRRDFVKLLNRLLAAVGLGALAAPLVAYFFPAKLEEIPSEPVLVGPENELAVNGSKTVRFGRYPALVIKTPEGLRAYSAVCTHFACVVSWDPDLGQIVCPCHEGYFDPLDGHVISGPPPTPLLSLKADIVDGDIYVAPGGEA